MKRWIIENPEGNLKLYYKDFAAAQANNPTAISIKECTDYGYLAYVEKIKASATETLLNYKGKIVYKIPHNSKFVLVQLLYDMIDGKPFYYDSLQFQNHDVAWVLPVTWEMISPQEFCERFLNDAPMDLPIEVISQRALKSLKPIKFWFKNGCAYYRDANGYFYFVYKRDLPNKKSRDEYEKFKGNDNAVWACMELSGRSKYTGWYASEREFLDEYRKFQADTPASHGSTSYAIKKRGYKKLPPEDRKVIFRLPYFRLDTELKHDSCTTHVAQKWCALMEAHKQFGDEPRILNADLIEDLIKRWIAYNENAPKQNDGSVVAFKPEQIPITDNETKINTARQFINMQQIQNRRFMFNPQTRTLLLGRQHGNNVLTGSHAEEHGDMNTGESFDDFIRGWIGVGNKYEDGIIHFAPPIPTHNAGLFDKGFTTLKMFIQNGANGKTVIRGFPCKWEQALSSIIPVEKNAA